MTFPYGGRVTVGSMEPTGDRLLRIGEVARLVGVKVPTIRNYEQRTLLQPSTRSEAGHRLYGAEEVAQLRFIKRANGERTFRA